MRLVIGISGASGVWLGYKLLQILKSYTDIETHLVITEGAIKNFALETTLDIAEVLKLADFSYANNNLGALIASGSFTTDGMVIVPCSMKTLAGIVHGYVAYYDQPAATIYDHTSEMDVNKMYDTRTNRELVTGYAGIKGYEIGVNYTVARNVMAAFNYFDYQGADNNIIKDRMMWTQLYYIF